MQTSPTERPRKLLDSYETGARVLLKKNSSNIVSRFSYEWLTATDSKIYQTWLAIKNSTNPEQAPARSLAEKQIQEVIHRHSSGILGWFTRFYHRLLNLFGAGITEEQRKELRKELSAWSAAREKESQAPATEKALQNHDLHTKDPLSTAFQKLENLHGEDSASYLDAAKEQFGADHLFVNKFNDTSNPDKECYIVGFGVEAGLDELKEKISLYLFNENSTSANAKAFFKQHTFVEEYAGVPTLWLSEKPSTHLLKEYDNVVLATTRQEFCDDLVEKTIAFAAEKSPVSDKIPDASVHPSSPTFTIPEAFATKINSKNLIDNNNDFAIYIRNIGVAFKATAWKLRRAPGSMQYEMGFCYKKLDDIKKEIKKELGVDDVFFDNCKIEPSLTDSNANTLWFVGPQTDALLKATYRGNSIQIQEYLEERRWATSDIVKNGGFGLKYDNSWIVQQLNKHGTLTQNSGTQNSGNWCVTVEDGLIDGVSNFKRFQILIEWISAGCIVCPDIDAQTDESRELIEITKQEDGKIRISFGKRFSDLLENGSVADDEDDK